MQRRLPAPTGPRYVAKFSNGVHQVFDTVYYGVVGSAPNERAAQRRADELNARKAVRK